MTTDPARALDPAIADAIRDLPPVLDRERAADVLGVSPRTVSRWIRAGRLRALRLTPGAGSGGVRILRAELARLLTEAAA
ncbi:MAG: helix-turn-helix domain-containing protein [Planctomycetota bacterium]